MVSKISLAELSLSFCPILLVLPGMVKKATACMHASQIKHENITLPVYCITPVKYFIVI